MSKIGLLSFQDNKLNVYRKEATKETTNKLGITQAWQQSQERMNRELKALRSTNGNRTCVSLKNEVAEMVRLQREEEMLSLHGAGDAVVVPELQHLCTDPCTWSRMSAKEKPLTFLSYTNAPLSKYIPLAMLQMVHF